MSSLGESDSQCLGVHACLPALPRTFVSAAFTGRHTGLAGWVDMCHSLANTLEPTPCLNTHTYTQSHTYTPELASQHTCLLAD